MSNLLGPNYVSQKHEDANRLRCAFPLNLSKEVDSVLYFIHISRLSPTEGDIGSVFINGEDIHIPSRVYYPEIETQYYTELRRIQKLILGCLYTRHHNGYVRERYLENLFNAKQEWIAPFILALTAEYVIEISRKIDVNVGTLDKEIYSHFASENLQFIRLCQQRIISYWHYYYSYIPFKDYPSYKIFRYLGLWTGHDAKRLLSRSHKNL